MAMVLTAASKDSRLLFGRWESYVRGDFQIFILPQFQDMQKKGLKLITSRLSGFGEIILSIDT
jgi:hypothetical protein